jgi:YHS domain-containing protein
MCLSALLMLAPVARAQVATATSHPALAPAAKSQVSALCPVDHRSVNAGVFSRFRGKRVYFCGSACRERFDRAPDDFADALRAQWAALKPLRVQVKCPVTGRPIDRSVFVEAADSDLYFADAAARAAWVRDPAQYAERLDACFTFQTTCGTCENEPRAGVWREFGGRTVYFCCPGCMERMKQDPAAFLPTIEKQVAANEAAWRARSESAPNPDASWRRP